MNCIKCDVKQNYYYKIHNSQFIGDHDLIYLHCYSKVINLIYTLFNVVESDIF